jgi:hypothetical protein
MSEEVREELEERLLEDPSFRERLKRTVNDIQFLSLAAQEGYLLSFEDLPRIRAILEQPDA